MSKSNIFTPTPKKDFANIGNIGGIDGAAYPDKQALWQAIKELGTTTPSVIRELGEYSFRPGGPEQIIK